MSLFESLVVLLTIIGLMLQAIEVFKPKSSKLRQVSHQVTRWLRSRFFHNKVVRIPFDDTPQDSSTDSNRLRMDKKDKGF